MDYIKEAKKLGFSNTAIMDTKKLVFKPEYRKFCEENQCGCYNVNPACPPECGTVETMKQRVFAYEKALILQTIQSKDMDYKMAKLAHNKLTEQLASKIMESGNTDLLIMSAGPYRHYSCLSAYCVDAQEMADAVGMTCWGPMIRYGIFHKFYFMETYNGKHLHMRSGMERLTYALIIVLVATMSAWIMAMLLHLQPVDFIKIRMSAAMWILTRLAASFFGVFGFSIMFNSPVRIACSTAVLGAIANTLRLELVDLVALPPAVAAFIGALTAGLLASLLKNKVGYPRISVTVPSIVVMVPGLYLYRGFYNLGIMSLSVSTSWFAAALLIIASLPLGLIFARILTDKTFRYCT